MIYFIHGTDTKKAREKLHVLSDSLRAKKPDATFFKIDADTFDETKIDELILSRGLFEEKYIVFYDNIFENKTAKEEILKKIKELAKSPNIFLFLEGKTDKKTLEKFEKYAEKIVLCEEDNKGKDREVGTGKGESASFKDFKIFDISDAFGARNKKLLWVLYQKSKFYDTAPEEVHGILFWQLKSMIIASKSANAKESGLNPFVFRKATVFAKNFSGYELKKISSKLVSLYHDSRRGLVGFDTGLEKFILENI